MDDSLYRAALIVFHQELGLPLIEAGRFASAVVVWSAETPKARAAVLEEHGAALRSAGAGRSEAEAIREEAARLAEAEAIKDRAMEAEHLSLDPSSVEADISLQFAGSAAAMEMLATKIRTLQPGGRHE